MELFENIGKIVGAVQKNKKTIDKVAKSAVKLQSGLSAAVDFDKVKEAQGTFAGTIRVSAKKDLKLDEIRLSFNQYIYSYLSTSGDRHRWKEYFIGTQTLDALSLAAGESQELGFQIQYEAEMRDDERERVEKKDATIKDLMKMSHFRKNGRGMGTEWKFQLVVVYVLSGGQEIKDAHPVHIG